MIENETSWWTYFPTHKQDIKIKGSGGYKDKSITDRAVKPGYEFK